MDPILKKQSQQFGQLNQILVEEILKLENKKVFLDSSKIMRHALYLSLIEKFDFYIIWLSRDPRAQVSSALKYNKWSVEEAAQRWKKEMIDNEKTLKRANLKYFTLSYEALCREPEKEMKEILTFTGLNPDAFSLDFREQTQHIMGNASMRLGKDDKIVERKDWKDRLTADQMTIIEKITSDYQHLYSN